MGRERDGERGVEWREEGGRARKGRDRKREGEKGGGKREEGKRARVRGERERNLEGLVCRSKYISGRQAVRWVAKEEEVVAVRKVVKRLALDQLSIQK